MATVEASPDKARCPRCRYDQRGALASWTESCPMHGRCTECGLEFDWAYVLHPEKFEPRWCVEFAQTGGVPRACLSTFTRSFWPRGFWRRHNMAHALRGRRLLAYCLFLLLAMAMLYVVVQVAVAVWVRYQVEQDLLERRQRASRYLVQFQSRQTEERYDELRDLGLTEEQIEEERAFDAAHIARMQAVIQGQIAVDQSYLNAIYEAVFFPLSPLTNGSVQDPTGWYGASYPAPIELYDGLLDRLLSRRATFGPNPTAGFLPTSVVFLGMGTAGLLVLPLTMAFLPVSRRRARVRWSHILRVFIYSLFLPVVFVYLTLAGFALTTFGATERLGSILTFAITTAGPWIGLVLWWAAAIRHYLRIPHALGVAFLLAVLVCLLMIAVLVSGAAAIGALHHLLA